MEILRPKSHIVLIFNVIFMILRVRFVYRRCNFGSNANCDATTFRRWCKTDHLSGVLGGGAGSSTGEAILGHVLGNRQNNVTNALSQQTGMNAGSIGQLLTMLAPIVMGALGKAQAKSGFDPGALSGYLNGQRKQAQESSPDMMGMLTSLLDADKDGSIMDDLGNIAGKLFKNQ
jgi:hypothetical protein